MDMNVFQHSMIQGLLAELCCKAASYCTTTCCVPLNIALLRDYHCTIIALLQHLIAPNQYMWCHAGTAGSPACIVSNDHGGQLWRYVMPDHAVDLDACPVGHGSGVYKTANSVKSVVAVVGSAHVRGIVAELQQMQLQSDL